MLREALKISSPLALVSREVPRFHGGSLWHCTPGADTSPEQTPPGSRPPTRSRPPKEQPPHRGADTPPGADPPEQNPQEQTHRRGADTSPPQQMATAADSTHPTGMHSCFTH